MFTTKSPQESVEKLGIEGLRDSLIPSDMDRMLIHPNKMFGFNPPIPLNIGSVQAQRQIFSSTDTPYVISHVASMPI